MINCQNCENYDQANSYCNLFRHAIHLGCQSGTERKPRNNYERLKAMSMEEMTVWFAAMLGAIPFDGTGNEYNKWLNWLKEEITDG